MLNVIDLKGIFWVQGGRCRGAVSIVLISNVYSVQYTAVQSECTQKSKMAAASLWASAL